MFARRRKLNINDSATFSTPLLLPSFSSKGFPEVDKILKTAEEFIADNILISAYDIHHKFVANNVSFPELLFLDSGGYEASKDVEFSDLGYTEHDPKEWSRDQHKNIISNWNSTTPTIFISYDSPKERCPIKEQIDHANELFKTTKGGRELLIKPETETQTTVNIDSIIPIVKHFHSFDVIGLTEKELGSSVLNRMINISHIRNAMNDAGLKDMPIHIFGSLDTVTTPLYFIAGADIFDGLTWLRFAYHDGITTYTHNHAALHIGLQTKDQLAVGLIWSSNYYYLRELELSMKRFLNKNNFSEFAYHSEFFEKSYQALIAKMEE